MTAPDGDRPRLLSRAFWAMMALALLSFLAAAAVVTFGPARPSASPRHGSAPAPLAEASRGAKTATPDPPLGPP